uniref:ShKT domain-containing protein n=1 Tax=Enterobius vermicularis TaxID=51028 RepID=A0A0N4V140_ENTVE
LLLLCFDILLTRQRIIWLPLKNFYIFCLCGVASLKTIIVQYCPATCGMCNETGTAGVCKDENAAVCDVMKLLCHDSSKKATLLTTCPKTCNCLAKWLLIRETVLKMTDFTASSSCTDVASDCAAKSSLCNNSVYYSLMRQQCAKTCKFC